MLRIIVEVHPGGDSSRRYDIATCDVGNVSDLADVSDYDWREHGEERGGQRRPGRRGRVLGHRRDDGAWELVRRVAEALAKKEERP